MHIDGCSHSGIIWHMPYLSFSIFLIFPSTISISSRHSDSFVLFIPYYLNISLQQSKIFISCTLGSFNGSFVSFVFWPFCGPFGCIMGTSDGRYRSMQHCYCVLHIGLFSERFVLRTAFWDSLKLAPECMSTFFSIPNVDSLSRICGCKTGGRRRE